MIIIIIVIIITVPVSDGTKIYLYEVNANEGKLN